MCALDQKTRELVTLAKEGDESALNRLYSTYAERVRWMMRFRMSRELRSKLESMDLVQEVLIHSFGGLKDFTYRDEGDFIRWLSRIAENELRGSLRRMYAEKRNIRKEIRLINNNPTTVGGTHDPVETTTPSVIMSRKEDLVRLEKAMDKLKPRYREVIVLTKIEGLSYEEVGARLNMSLDAVRMLATRAMVALAATYRKSNDNAY
ncbi:MAG: sigma-70 family RNA polymerase sigma factor [Sedimentisphaerales bacterium]|nr:sigma-70 family RNA polymerase sigma factor [Sedimentisphaerales bacterium]